jgi:hypothetical protein
VSRTRNLTGDLFHVLVATCAPACPIDRLWGRPNTWVQTMSLYFFRISHGRYSGASEHASQFESREAAWSEMTKVCGNLLSGISRSLKQDSEWHVELLDESKKPVFRIRLVAETLG